MNQQLLTGFTEEQKKNFAKFFDHTLLKPDAREHQIRDLCDEAKKLKVASVCVQPFYVSLATKLLEDSDVNVGTVVGFPFGSDIIAVKTFEAHRAVQKGAKELDMVINIGALKDQKFDHVFQDIFEVVKECRLTDCVCKVILETALLTDEEKKEACRIIIAAGAHYIKTSTGFAASGANLSDMVLIRETIGTARIGIKAAGGIRNLSDAVNFIKAGATRIGTSSTVKIMEEFFRLI
jgi:deoxyribose-phosphate aldolase